MVFHFIWLASKIRTKKKLQDEQHQFLERQSQSQEEFHKWLINFSIIVSIFNTEIVRTARELNVVESLVRECIWMKKKIQADVMRESV